MPTAFAADVHRSPISLIAAWLIALQAFLAGVATAQAAVMPVSAPSDGGAICHGDGTSGPAAPSAPGADKVWNLCCTFCATTSSATVPPEAPQMAPLVSWGQERHPTLTRFTVAVARGAVRAGPSQAPPQLA